MPSDDHRTAFITGLRALADFLETTPALPVPRTQAIIHYFPKRTTDPQMREEMDQIAALLGTQINAEAAAHGHYGTAVHFGPVTYDITAILAPARDRHAARDSYYDCITTDTDQTHAA
ncbi:hypothetical protein Misp01_52110 [Microtetraspora sp. NBRC 13810]|uniref:hypothetical protein n=1 Tax=Microtetraspora sp. NBRC 13810 TaxID=3030990 RepID=UPI002552E114|nr:hypothetical protein [Microtetraspora sp. NBRC 13810]GLW10082.1 hypothetical protein Misp01_52110 [Microtetraspora sp. NBRC 13810]